MVSLIDLSRRSLDTVRAGLKSGCPEYFHRDLQAARAVAHATARSLLTRRTCAEVERAGGRDLGRLLQFAPKMDRSVLDCLLVHLDWLERAERAAAEPNLRGEICEDTAILWWPVGSPTCAQPLGGAL